MQEIIIRKVRYVISHVRHYFLLNDVLCNIKNLSSNNIDDLLFKNSNTSQYFASYSNSY